MNANRICDVCYPSEPILIIIINLFDVYLQPISDQLQPYHPQHNRDLQISM